MMEIASHADIELEAKIQYIIEGIQDEPVNKSILYGARSVKELRTRLSQYEAMKSSSKPKPQVSRPGKEAVRQQDTNAQGKRQCFNCGGKDHVGTSCPLAKKGRKCFRCGEFGHIAPQCEKKDDTKTVNECSTATSRDCKVYKTVKIHGKDIVALLDTGSDLHFIKAEQYIRLGSPPLTGAEVRYKGIGAKSMFTIGSFDINVQIDDDVFQLTMHVISDACLNYDLLLGSELLRYADIRLDGTNAIVTKCKRETSVTHAMDDNDVPEIFCIEAIDATEDDRSDQPSRVDTSNIEDLGVKRELEAMIDGYKSQATKQVGIKMEIVLRDDTPIYQRPRRLSEVERVQVNEQIDKWVRDGIVRPSTSEYASPIVLVKKRMVVQDFA
jgi:Arginine methyltransferase-interacting protein, contains RING Zn-finger